MKNGIAAMMCLGVLSGTMTLALLSAQTAQAQRRLPELRGQRTSQPAALPAGVRVIRDLPYGSDPLQRFDVYLPAGEVHDAPVISMVHGGGWRRGDKAYSNVFANKVTRWVSRGFIFISTNYRLLPEADPLEQANDVARALAAAQQRADEWGADSSKFILMGHSAGAHLVALLAAKPEIANRFNVTPWLGTVSLDSASIDVVKIMQGRHAALYDQAFGNDPTAWLAASPYQQLSTAIAPFLAVCSSRRRDSCPPARAFATKAQSLGSHVTVLPEDMGHGPINSELGLPSDYTRQVEAFLAGLDPVVARLLAI